MTGSGAPVSAGVLAGLLAGRGAYRLSVLLAGVVLAGSWSGPDFDAYAAALGRYAVLIPLSVLGVEKAALALLPNARRSADQLTGILVLLPVPLVVVSLGVLALSFVVAPLPVAVAGPAGLLSIGLGLNQVAVGLRRARGRTRPDAVNHLALAAAVLLLTLLSVAGWLGPAGFLRALLAVVAVLTAMQLVLLRPRVGGRLARSLTGPAVRTSALMASADIAGGASVSAIFLILATTRFADSAGDLYLATIASMLMVNVYSYLMRVFQPQVSVALRSVRPAELAERVSGWLRLIAIAGLPYVLVGMVGVAASPLSGPVAAVGLWALCVPLFVATGSVNYVFENAGRGPLRATAAGSMAGLAGVVGAALLLTPSHGVLGAVAALGAGEVAHAALLLRWLHRRSTPAAAGPGRRVSGPTGGRRRAPTERAAP